MPMAICQANKRFGGDIGLQIFYFSFEKTMAMDPWHFTS